MFDLIQKNKRIVQIVLVLIILPFAFFGIDSFRQSDSSGVVATVGGQKITQGEFLRALGNRQESIRRATGGKAEANLLNGTEVRFAVANDLVRQRLLITQALRAKLAVPDKQLQAAIKEMKEFQEANTFSLPLYEKTLKLNHLSPASFEESKKRDLLLEQSAGAVINTGFVPSRNVDQIIRIAEQQREISTYVIPEKQYLATVTLEEGAIKKYYDAHQADFRVTDQVRVTYVVFSPDSIAEHVIVSGAELRKYYEDHAAQFTQQAKRQAKHILVKFPEKATAEEKDALRRKAEDLLAQAKRNPKQFADLAKKYSGDIGSAPSGGDLGYFMRGTMVKQFDNAVFNIKLNEIVGPIETQYGFHIIKLTGIQSTNFDAVKSEIEQQLKKQKATTVFSAEAENFGNILWDQADSLKPVADAYKLTIQTSPWLQRNSHADGQLQNHKFLEAVFSPDTLKNKRNTAPVEIAASTLVAARLLDFKAAHIKPLEDVRNEIEIKLKSKIADKAVVKDGAEKLKKLQQGEQVNIAWTPAQNIYQRQARTGSDTVLEGAFRLDITKLPAYGAIKSSNGITLVRVSRVIENEEIFPETKKILAEQLQKLLVGEELSAYIAGLKSRADVRFNQQILNLKATDQN